MFNFYMNQEKNSYTIDQESKNKVIKEKNILYTMKINYYEKLYSNIN